MRSGPCARTHTGDGFLNHSHTKTKTSQVKIGNPAHVRLAKFCLISYFNLLLLHAYVRYKEYEHDKTFTLYAFHTYDLHPTALDTLVFFFIGRMHLRAGIDTLNFQIPVMLGGWFFSAMTECSWARHNVSAYQIKCEWPTELFMFVGCGLIVIVLILVYHIRAGWKDGILLSRLVEVSEAKSEAKR